MPKSNIRIIWTSTYEWYVVRCECKNWHQQDMCLKEIVLHAQNMMTILGSIINKFGEDPHDHLLSIRIFTLKRKKIFI